MCSRRRVATVPVDGGGTWLSCPEDALSRCQLAPRERTTAPPPARDPRDRGGCPRPAAASEQPLLVAPLTLPPRERRADVAPRQGQVVARHAGLRPPGGARTRPARSGRGDGDAAGRGGASAALARRTPTPAPTPLRPPTAPIAAPEMPPRGAAPTLRRPRAPPPRCGRLWGRPARSRRRRRPPELARRSRRRKRPPEGRFLPLRPPPEVPPPGLGRPPPGRPHR